MTSRSRFLATLAALALASACGSSQPKGAGGATTTQTTTQSTSSSSGPGMGGGPGTSSSGGGMGGAGGSSSGGGMGGGTTTCDPTQTLTYSFTLALWFDPTTIQVHVVAAAYTSDGTLGAEHSGDLGGTNPTVFSFSEYGCTPKVDVQATYTNVPDAGPPTQCTSMGTLTDANITLKPPTQTDQPVCSAPAIQ